MSLSRTITCEVTLAAREGLPLPADPSADPVVAAGRQLTDDLFASAHAIGELMLEVAPAYLSDTETATGVLALLCEEIGEPLEHGLATRRYAAVVTEGDIEV